MEWTVRDPAGRVHVKRSKTKVFTHALVRRNVGSDHYFVNWATSEQNAVKESRVHFSQRDYVNVVTLDRKEA